MSKRVLDVGNCVPDHAAICRLIEGRFGASVEQAYDSDDALARLRSESFDLVLVNRKLDADNSDGLAIIQQIKADPLLCEVPVMLITNYAEHQQRAVAAGAVPGFGKSALQSPATLERLGRILGGTC
jgi:two-component system chemotaxis response regulator CheY